MIRVMIISQHAQVREDLCTALQLVENLVPVGSAPDQDRAARLAEMTCPDAILVDLEMQGGAGCEAIHELHRLRPGLVVIALTAHDDPDTREMAVGAGAAGVMVKGLDLAEMAASIQALVEGS